MGIGVWCGLSHAESAGPRGGAGRAPALLGPRFPVGGPEDLWGRDLAGEAPCLVPGVQAQLWVPGPRMYPTSPRAVRFPTPIWVRPYQDRALRRQKDEPGAETPFAVKRPLQSETAGDAQDGSRCRLRVPASQEQELGLLGSSGALVLSAWGEWPRAGSRSPHRPLPGHSRASRVLSGRLSWVSTPRLLTQEEEGTGLGSPPSSQGPAPDPCGRTSPGEARPPPV